MIYKNQEYTFQTVQNCSTSTTKLSAKKSIQATLIPQERRDGFREMPAKQAYVAVMTGFKKQQSWPTRDFMAVVVIVSH